MFLQFCLSWENWTFRDFSAWHHELWIDWRNNVQKLFLFKWHKQGDCIDITLSFRLTEVLLLFSSGIGARNDNDPFVKNLFCAGGSIRKPCKVICERGVPVLVAAWNSRLHFTHCFTTFLPSNCSDRTYWHTSDVDCLPLFCAPNLTVKHLP